MNLNQIMKEKPPEQPKPLAQPKMTSEEIEQTVSSFDSMTQEELQQAVSGLNPTDMKEIILKLQSTVSEMQSLNQKAKSELMKAGEKIEALTKRAAKVSESEAKLKKAIYEKNAAEDKSYNLQIEASKQSRIAAEAEKKESDAIIEKSDAVRKRLSAEKSERETKNRYRAGFVGIEIFTTAVALMELIKHTVALKECGKWFLNRINNLIWIVTFFKNIFFKLENLIAVKFSTNAVISYSIAAIIYLTVGTALIFLSVCLLSKVKKIIYNIQKAYKNYPNDEMKFFSSVAMVTALFYGCIFFYEPTTSLIPLNILSVWLIVTTLEIIAFNYTVISLGLSYSLQ